MRVLLLDGHNLLYRAFTSLPRSITARDGLPINAVYGMLSAVLRLCRDLDAHHAVAAFDVPEGPTFRHQLYAGYQAQRGPLGGEYAEDFARQVGIAMRVFPTAGIPAVSRPGFEADDVMGSLAVRLSNEGHSAVIVSTDRDLLQMVRAGIAVATPANPPVVASSDDDVRARLGVPAGGVTVFKALAGDASDNIPGVAGIGATTAARLVNQFATLDNIYAHLDELPARARAALEGGREDAYLFERIVTVVTSLDVSSELSTLGAISVALNERARSILDRAGYGGAVEGESGTPEGIRTPGL